MTIESNHFSSFSDMLKTSLGSKLDETAESFVDMLAPDVVMEFPFAPANGVSKVEGKQALVDYLASLQHLLELETVSKPTVHHSEGQNIVILEFTCVGHALLTNRPYNQRYISVITLKNKKIQRYLDYWNPLIALEAFGNFNQLQPNAGVKS